MHIMDIQKILLENSDDFIFNLTEVETITALL